MQIQLGKALWDIGDALKVDAAGFADVYEASGALESDAVAKFVKKEPGATRELLIGDFLMAQKSTNVIPVLDSGEHGGHWVLVMPRAEMSLAQRLRQGDPIELAECVGILTDIAQALAGLEGHIVHRDLKPANVLFYEGRWCVADFGISKYSDAATASETRKHLGTDFYAAPEQWRFERATPKTDVYSFGVMAYEVLEGRLPFPGPDFRGQHIGQAPPEPKAGPSRLRNVIMECLDKAPEVRPSAAQLVARLRKVTIEPASPGARRLATANAEALARQARASAERLAAEDEAARRERLFSSASRMFESISEPLRESIEDEASTVSIDLGAPGSQPLFLAVLSGAKLGVTRPIPTRDEWRGPFDVIASAAITVHRPRQDRGGWLGRSHSLWFCDPKAAGEFGWYELAFMPFMSAGEVVPFARQPEEAGTAFSNVIGTEQLAWPVTEVDRDDPSEFLDRWLGWFGDAASGTLAMPSTMPERDPSNSWRRG